METFFKTLSVILIMLVAGCNAYDTAESWNKRVEENKQRSRETMTKNLNLAIESAIQAGIEVFSVPLTMEDVLFNDEKTLVASVYEKAKKELALNEYIFDYAYKCGQLHIPCSLKWEKTIFLKK